MPSSRIFPIQGSNDISCISYIEGRFFFFFNCWVTSKAQTVGVEAGDISIWRHAKSLQLCLTLWDLMDCNLPVSSVHTILQVKYWSLLQFPALWDLPNPGIKPMSLMPPALAGGFSTTGATWDSRHSKNQLLVEEGRKWPLPIEKT